ncbi:hypothetical protein GL263_05930 [Streptomyces durbertensis]|uniref:Uncharacterized protein n=1 Tax=Streptomyces durbertensis TaxID=2448886 RepID=A0ABR6EDG5_9ACTN|nr:hypothetical protein [Streptomyces durbertensis]MBB1243107.1 hypothetical protein [Streptomyces durbertensis]
MPTPHGSRGGMAFSADELRVLRRALANAAQPTLVSDHEVRACLRLARAVDETAAEADRARAFLLADLERYRAALPGSAAGYLTQLQEALTSGYVPTDEDLSALRGLCAERTGPYEAARRAMLLVRAALPGVRGPLLLLPGGLPDGPSGGLSGLPASRPGGRPEVRPGRLPEARPGGRPMTAAPTCADENKPRPEPKPPARPRPASPAKPSRPGPDPARPVPTPAEVFPPRRRPAPPPAQDVLPAALLA